jgi:transposase
VKEFGVYNEDLVALSQWLIDNEIKTVAMESTGTYWQSLFATLQGAGLEVLLCNGKLPETLKARRPMCRTANGSKASYTRLVERKFLSDEATEH